LKALAKKMTHVDDAIEKEFQGRISPTKLENQQFRLRRKGTACLPQGDV